MGRCIMASIFQLSCLLAVVIAVSQAHYCARPLTRRQCSSIKIKCDPVTKEKCETAHGLFLERGGTCHQCDICVKFVGLGESCGGEGFPTPTCKYPNLCSTDNVCVSSCKYAPIRRRAYKAKQAPLFYKNHHPTTIYRKHHPEKNANNV